MNYKLYLRVLVATFIVFSLTACATNSSGISIKIYSANYLNPDIDGNASPVVVSIYQLKSPFRFDASNYQALAKNNSSILGEELIDRRTIEIRPGEHKTINLGLAQETHYIGILAEYRKINQGQWHTTLKIPSRSEETNIVINLESQGISAELVKAY